MAEDPRRSVTIEAGACLLRSGYGQENLSSLLGAERTKACIARTAPEMPKFHTILRGWAADETHRD